MSRFENTYDGWRDVTDNDKLLSGGLYVAFEHVLDRLAKLEADAAKPKPEPKTIIATSDLGDHLAGADSTRDAPKPREPGWYPVWADRPCLLEWTGKKWRSVTWVELPEPQNPPGWKISPRIQEPSE